MPYIKQERREQASWALDGPGELNYAITELLLKYLDVRGIKYQYINDCIGALECAKLELYRRIAAPYEDQKMKENGDVY